MNVTSQEVSIHWEEVHPPVRLTRAANMKKVREESMRLANSRRQEMFRNSKYMEDRDMEVRSKIQQRTKTAKTMKGKRLLMAAEVENNLIQDKASRMEIIGADVEALYPSLEAVQVANIVYQAVMDSDIKFKGVNYQEGARYIALTSTEQECRLGPLRRVLPWRRYVHGTRPGITGEGPAGADTGDQDQWEFPRVQLTRLEKRLIVAKTMHTAVLTLFKTHCYTFGGKYFLQKQGGPIGLRSTCCIARLVMTWWDKQLLELVAKSNLELEEKQRYMDDIRLWCFPIRLGWRWQEDELVFSMEWRREELEKGMTGLQKTLEVMERMMNSICDFLNLTMESVDDFEGVLPTLDLTIWVRQAATKQCSGFTQSQCPATQCSREQAPCLKT